MDLAVDFFFSFAYLVLSFVVMIYIFKWSAQFAYGIKPTVGQSLFQWIIIVIIQVFLAYFFLVLVNPFFFG